MKTTLSKIVCSLAVGSLLVAGSLPVHSAEVTQTSGDGYGASSFDTGTKWSDGRAPSAGNDYSTAFLFRTPNGGNTNITFAGNSLTMNTGSQFSYKGAIAGPIITVNNLHMNGGVIVNGSGGSFTLAGSLILDHASAPTISNSTANLDITTISSSISGTGLLTVSGNGKLILTNAGNTNSGGAKVASGSTLAIAAAGAGGTANINLEGAGKLELQLVTSFADTSSLTLTASSLGVTLGFTGTDYLAALTYDGTTYNTAGMTFGATGSGATHEFSNFTGTGLLAIVPEPSTWGLLSLGLTVVVTLSRRRRAL